MRREELLQTLLNCRPCWLKIAGDVRRIIKTTVLALLLLVLGGHPRAAENQPKVITLSCDGMLTPTCGANKPEVPQPLQKTGVIVNFDEPPCFFGYVVPIDDVDEASINFGGRQIVDYGFSVAIRGNIDRVTGRMDATTVLSDPNCHDPV